MVMHDKCRKDFSRAFPLAFKARDGRIGFWHVGGRICPWSKFNRHSDFMQLFVLPTAYQQHARNEHNALDLKDDRRETPADIGGELGGELRFSERRRAVLSCFTNLSSVPRSMFNDSKY
jgi:hypothetical protein